MIGLNEIVQLCMDLVKRAEIAEARVVELEKLYEHTNSQLGLVQQDFDTYKRQHNQGYCNRTG